MCLAANLQTKLRRAARIRILAMVIVAIGVASATPCVAAQTEVSIAKQFGLAFLPLIVMQKQHLVEKAAARNGLPNVTVKWVTLSGGANANDALLSGSLDFVSGGAAPLIEIWSATKGAVKGVASVSAMPFTLVSTNPKVKTIRDFTAADRIALPAVRVSIQAITLEMAAAKVFGKSHYNKLDPWTVSMNNPDALIALTAGHSGVTAHFSGPPFPTEELEDPKAHEVLNSYDVLGGPGMLVGLYTTTKFRDAHPRLYKSVLEALGEADRIIDANKQAAARTYIAATKSKLPERMVEKIISDPRVQFSLTPRNTMKYARFMCYTRMIKRCPRTWKDLFFPDIASLPGN